MADCAFDGDGHKDRRRVWQTDAGSQHPGQFRCSLIRDHQRAIPPLRVGLGHCGQQEPRRGRIRAIEGFPVCPGKWPRPPEQDRPHERDLNMVRQTPSLKPHGHVQILYSDGVIRTPVRSKI